MAFILRSLECFLIRDFAFSYTATLASLEALVFAECLLSNDLQCRRVFCVDVDVDVDVDVVISAYLS